jgi:Na+/H+-dicarboxylate symporter
MGIDQFLDMGRSATNAVGNAIATAVVANWEDALETSPQESPQQPAPVAAHAG